MVQLHTVGGNAKTSYGIYVNSSLVDDTGWENGDCLRITVVDRELILVTHEQMPVDQWIELYDAATANETIDEMDPADLVKLRDFSDGSDGRRPSSVTSLSQLSDSGHRVLVTNAVNRLQLSSNTSIHRRTNLGVLVLSPASIETEDVNKRVRGVLDKRESQLRNSSNTTE